MPKGKTDQFTVGGNVSEYREVTKLGRNWIGFEWPVKVVTSTMNHFHPVQPPFLKSSTTARLMTEII